MVLDYTVLDKFVSKSSETVFSTVFHNNFRPDKASAVNSDAFVENVGVNVC